MPFFGLTEIVTAIYVYLGQQLQIDACGFTSLIDLSALLTLTQTDIFIYLNLVIDAKKIFSLYLPINT